MSAEPAPLLAYFGHHKSGSHWILSIVHAVCEKLALKVKHAHEPDHFERDLPACRDREGFTVLTYINAHYRYIRDLDVRGFHVVRDPRDMIVSGYFSHLQSHPDSCWPDLQTYRPALRSVDKASGLLLEMEFSSAFMDDLRSWPSHPPGVILVKFEDLVERPYPEFLRIFRHLGLFGDRLSQSDLQSVLARFSFEELSKGRRPGEEDVGNHYRKGLPGDWKNHFTAAQTWAFKRRYNDILIQYGYESDDRWQGAANVEPGLSTAHVVDLTRARLRDWLRQLKLALRAKAKPRRNAPADEK